MKRTVPALTKDAFWSVQLKAQCTLGPPQVTGIQHYAHSRRLGNTQHNVVKFYIATKRHVANNGNAQWMMKIIFEYGYSASFKCTLRNLSGMYSTQEGSLPRK